MINLFLCLDFFLLICKIEIISWGVGWIHEIMVVKGTYFLKRKTFKLVQSRIDKNSHQCGGMAHYDQLQKLIWGIFCPLLTAVNSIFIRLVFKGSFSFPPASHGGTEDTLVYSTSAISHGLSKVWTLLLTRSSNVGLHLPTVRKGETHRWFSKPYFEVFRSSTFGEMI